ncbi:metallophosphoesterase family protein [Echinicola soli]|uniref:Phosphoesterase n=1 Tax=Echinicola soli TaxID=2591634 RepID=A0A514CLY1_9BACT|nr:metallophosphoesterase family protein [Echinicola soli]QDH80826.1 metallophosphoesterase family protein [Echinicola soli]
MVKIALISDSHSFIDDKILSHLQDVDEIWHAGDIGDEKVMEALPKDKKVRAVYGNIDDLACQQKYPEELIFDLEGARVMMIHIGGKPPRYAAGVKKHIKEIKPTIFICGHSHICKVEFDKELGCLYMNPGAVGNHGFHQVKTLLKFNLEAGQPKNLRVVELGKRGGV